MVRKVIILFVLFIVFAKADDCERQENSLSNAYILYEKAQAFFDNKEYKSAYDSINESYEMYANDQATVRLTYDCTHYIPSAYIPKITKYVDTSVKEFKRRELAILIKRYIHPNPYVLIQQKPYSTKVTLANVKKTARADVEGQLALEDVVLILQSGMTKEKLSFANVESMEQKSVSFAKAVSLDRLRLLMSERFQIELFKKD